MGQKISDLVATTGALIAAATTVLFEVAVDGNSKKVSKAELEIAIRNAMDAARIVTLSAATSITAALHSGRTCKLTGTGSQLDQTLPAASGSGAKFRFVCGAVNTSNHRVKVANSSDVMKGVVVILDNDGTTISSYAASGTDDTLTWNGTTTGGQIGDYFELEDIAANTWAVTGKFLCPAGSNPADPFSATV